MTGTSPAIVDDERRNLETEKGRETTFTTPIERDAGTNRHHIVRASGIEEIGRRRATTGTVRDGATIPGTVVETAIVIETGTGKGDVIGTPATDQEVLTAKAEIRIRMGRHPAITATERRNTMTGAAAGPIRTVTAATGTWKIALGAETTAVVADRARVHARTETR